MRFHCSLCVFIYHTYHFNGHSVFYHHEIDFAGADITIILMYVYLWTVIFWKDTIANYITNNCPSFEITNQANVYSENSE